MANIDQPPAAAAEPGERPGERPAVRVEPAPPAPPADAPTGMNPVGPLSRRFFPYRYLLLAVYGLFSAGCFTLLVWQPDKGWTGVGVGMPAGLAAAVAGAVLLLQAAFLSGAPHWRWPRPTRRRPMMVSQIVGAVVATLFSIGILLTLLSAVGASSDNLGNFYPLVLLVPLFAWFGWLAVFVLLWMRAPMSGFRRMYALLVAGSWLELLITVPVDAQVRKRTSCYCGEGSFFAMIIGLSLAGWTFGPGLVLLFLTRRVQRRSDLKVCIGCGYDLRGLSEPRCPECGLAFDPRLLSHPAPAQAAAPPGGTTAVAGKA